MSDTEFEKFVRETVDQIHVNKDGYELLVERDKLIDGGRLYLQLQAYRKDTDTGDWGYGRGAKYYLSPYMIDGEIVRLAFSALRAYDEHEDREAFTWCGRRVFGPHISLEALWEAADKVEYRP